MAGRRGARSGRGWDAIPPRTAFGAADEHPPGEPHGGETERGNVPVGRRRGSPGGLPDAAGPSEMGGRDAAGPSEMGRRDAGRPGVSGRRDTGSRAGRPAQSESEQAREICLRQLALRPRTRAELAKALAGKQISADVIAEVLDRYDEVGIIDDAAFARAWVSSRHHGRGLARRALANELRQRGVDAEVADEALGTLDDEEEAATARALVERKLRTATGTPEAIFRRLAGMLARKGYPAETEGDFEETLTLVDEVGFDGAFTFIYSPRRGTEAAAFVDQVDEDAMSDGVADTSF